MTATAELISDASRARYPDDAGFVERDGVRVYYEAFGEGEPAVLFLPSWSIVHSRIWKAQVPWFARRHRVAVFDGRGNGRSDRPAGRAAYCDTEMTADALAVLDAAGIERGVLVGPSRGARWALRLAAEQPERVSGLVIEGPGIELTQALTAKTVRSTFERATPAGRAAGALRSLLRLALSRPSLFVARTTRVGMRHTNPFEAARMFNRHTWHEDYRGFLEWFMRLVYVEPHSTKQIEDAIAYGLETTPATLVDTIAGDFFLDRATALDLCSRVRCPVLTIAGADDIITPPEWARELAKATGGRHLEVAGSGHSVASRHPVAFNLALHEFLDGIE
jgi:pimeloyl-ACP methyl ester carboxylesterase